MGSAYGRAFSHRGRNFHCSGRGYLHVSLDHNQRSIQHAVTGRGGGGGGGDSKSFSVPHPGDPDSSSARRRTTSGFRSTALVALVSKYTETNKALAAITSPRFQELFCKKCNFFPFRTPPPQTNFINLNQFVNYLHADSRFIESNLIFVTTAKLI